MDYNVVKDPSHTITWGYDVPRHLVGVTTYTRFKDAHTAHTFSHVHDIINVPTYTNNRTV
jgi:hypothetical protein